MPRDFPRSRRVEEQIQRVLGEVIRVEARDPRLAGAVVTAVRVSRDLSVAWVYVSSLEPEHEAAAIVDAFERAAGFLRSALAGELTVRQVPELRFRYDDVEQRAEALEQLIDAAVAADRRGHSDPVDDDGTPG